jgi:molybdenum cofactor cytidylyltransferase
MAPLTSEPALSFGVIILAAGQSRRMGRPKLLLSWGETSVLGHLVAQWRSLGAKQITAVCAPADEAMKTEMDRIGFAVQQRIINPAPGRGMFSSIQSAALWPEWSRDLTHWVIVLGDQPQLRPETLQALIQFSATRPLKVCQPRCAGHRQHPVVLPRQVFARLALSTAADLNEFLGSCEGDYCDLDDPGLDLDIDRPEDYQKALGLAGLGDSKG